MVIVEVLYCLRRILQDFWVERERERESVEDRQQDQGVGELLKLSKKKKEERLCNGGGRKSGTMQLASSW